MAGAPPSEPSAAIKAIKDVGADFQKCIASFKDILEEPLKGKCVEAEKQLGLMLSSLPESVSADPDVANAFKSVAESSKAMFDMANAAADKAIKDLQATRASVPDEVKKGIELQLASGAYIKKEDHEKAVQDATSAATAAAKEAAVVEVKILNDRRSLLATASLPVPEDKFLAGDDATFESRRKSAEKRVGELKPFKLPNDRVLALAWAEADESYQSSLTLMKTAFEAAQASAKTAGANGFINRTATDKKPLNKPTGVC